MTKKIIILIIIVIVLLVLSFMLLNKKTPEKEELKNDPKNEIKKETLVGQGEYSFETLSSTIAWEGRKTLIKNWVDSGTISLKSGKIVLAENNITKADLVVDMNSITTNKTGAGGGESKLTEHLKSKDFFDVENFPTAQFVLTSIIPNEVPNNYKVVGDITIKGITKSIEFPSLIYMDKENIFLEAEVILDRSMFDIKFGSTSFFKELGDKAIDDNFILKLKLIAKK